jgi:hypothetical protein
MTIRSLGALLVCLLLGCSKSEPIEKSASIASSASSAPSAAAVAAAAEAPAQPALAPSLSKLEGEVTVDVRVRGEDPKTLTFLIRERMLRLDLPADLAQSAGAGKVYQLVNVPEAKAITVLEAEKLAIEADLASLSKGLGGLTPPVGKGGKAQALERKAEKTGKHDTVAGHRCEEWSIVSGDGDRATMCLAEAEAAWLSLPKSSLAPDQKWAEQLLDGRRFPLRIVAFNDKGGVEARFEVREIRQKPLSAELFEVPAGFERRSMAEMMKGLSRALGAQPNMNKAIREPRKQP